MTDWLQEKDFAELEGQTPRHVRRRARDGEVRTKLSETTSRNGKPVRLYSRASLSLDAQKRLMARGVVVDNDSDQLALLPVAQALEVRDLVDPEDQKQAEERYEKIKLLDRWFREGWRPSFRLPDGSAITNSDQLAGYLAQQHGVGRATLWNWYGRFKKQGLAGLANKRRADADASRFFEQYPKASEFVMAEYLAKRSPSFQAIYEALDRNWPTLYNHGSQPCSYSTMVAHLKREIPKALTTLAREGEDAYDNKHQPFLRRDFDAPPNYMWVADHRKIDVFAYNDLFPFLPARQWMRLQLTAIIDYRSRLLVGWAWSVDPSWKSIASALRMALLRYGRPQVLLTDNGKDFKKIGRVDLENPALSGVISQLGIKQQYAIKFNARAKMIEPWNATMSKRFDPMWGAAYAGRNAKERSEDNNIALRKHQLWLEGRLDPKQPPLPAASELIRVFEAWLEGWYHTKHKVSGTGMKGRTPRQVFDQELPEEKRESLTLEQITPLLWERQKRMITHATLRINNAIYVAADGQSEANLRLHDASEVVVAYDPYNPANAVALLPSNELIAHLRPQQLLTHGERSGEAIADHISRNRTTKRQMKGFIQGLGIRHAAQGFGDLEHWRNQAGLTEIPDARMLPPPTALPDVAAEFNNSAATERLQPEDIAEQMQRLIEEAN